MKTKTFFLFAICVILLGSCKKDSIITTTSVDDPPPPKTIVESTIRGLVLDREGEPVIEATVTWGSTQIATDNNGIFVLKALVNGEEAVLKVQKSGYFDAFQTILPIAGTTMKTQLQLTPRLLSTSFQADQGGLLQLPEGSRVDFQPKGFVDEAGNPYTGTIHVYAFHIDPTLPNLAEIMPGNLLALNADGAQQALKSFGMINVELEGDNGQALQITTPATLTMPVPATLANQAPNSLPLWYFDKGTGLWQEEGEAELVNGTYVGNVAHFSFWNCDVPYDLVTLSGRFTADKYELAGTVRVTATALDRSAVAGLSEDGYFLGKVLKNTPLLLELIDPYCGDVIYSLELGSLNEDTNTGTININLTEDWVSLSGTLVDCNQEAVANGIAVVKINGNAYIVSAKPDGSLLAAFRSCGASSVSIEGLNWDAQERGNPQTYAISPTLNVGKVSTCGIAFSAYVKITINGEDYVIDNCVASLQPQDSIGTVHVLTAIDNFGSQNKVVYTFNFLDWNQDSNNPLWGMAFNVDRIGSPGKIFGFGGNYTIQSIQEGTQVGDFTIFRLDGVRIIDEVSGNEYENCTVELSALIE
ncbi:MAG: hypothetical protein R2828_34585 [Saprospiraceae bacterium]